jgi:hypothetical protein
MIFKSNVRKCPCYHLAFVHLVLCVWYKICNNLHKTGAVVLTVIWSLVPQFLVVVIKN